MNVFRGAVIVAAVISAAASAALAQAPASPYAYMVTYIEVTPSAEMQVADLLRHVAGASRAEPGNLRYEVLQQIDRRNQVAILEAWNDAKALAAHVGGAAMKQFRGQLDPLRIGFYDERPETGIDVSPLGAAPGKDAVYVITHIDVTGPFKDDAIVMMRKLAADSRREPNVARYDIWQQNNRLNHFAAHRGLEGTGRRWMLTIWRPARARSATSSAT